MRIYYDLIVWEEVDQYDLEKLQSRSQEFGKRLNGFGILSFNMRAQPPQQTQTQQQPAEQPVEQTEIEVEQPIEEEIIDE